MHLKTLRREAFTTWSARWQKPYCGGGWKLKKLDQTKARWGIKQDSHTQAGVHRNQVAGQVGIRGRAYQGGIPGVGSLEGVLAYREVLNRTHQVELA